MDSRISISLLKPGYAFTLPVETLDFLWWHKKVPIYMIWIDQYLPRRLNEYQYIMMSWFQSKPVHTPLATLCVSGDAILSGIVIFWKRWLVSFD